MKLRPSPWRKKPGDLYPPFPGSTFYAIGIGFCAFPLAAGAVLAAHGMWFLAVPLLLAGFWCLDLSARALMDALEGR